MLIQPHLAHAKINYPTVPNASGSGLYKKKSALQICKIIKMKLTLKPLNQQVVVLTGASSGIGR